MRTEKITRRLRPRLQAGTTTLAGAVAKAGVKQAQRKKTFVAAAKLTGQVQRDTVAMFAAAGQTQVATALALDSTQRAVTMLAPEHIEEGLVASARKHGLDDLANLATRINAVRDRVRVNKQKGHGGKPPLRLHRTKVATRIDKLGGRVAADKFDFYAGCKGSSLITDEVPARPEHALRFGLFGGRGA